MKKLLLALVAFFALSFGAFAAVNLNTATKDELDTVKGIGPVKAQAIIDYRQAHGPFKSVDELKNVKGFGEKSVAKMRPKLTVTGPTTVRSEPAPADRAQPAKTEPVKPVQTQPAQPEKSQPGKMEPAQPAKTQSAQPEKAEVKAHDKGAQAGKAGSKDEAKQGGAEKKGKKDKQSKKDKKKAQKEKKDKKKGKDGKQDQK